MLPYVPTGAAIYIKQSLLLVFCFFSERLHVFQTARRVTFPPTTWYILPTQLSYANGLQGIAQLLFTLSAMYTLPARIAGTCASVLDKRIKVSRLFIQFYRQQSSAGPIYVRTASSIQRMMCRRV